MGDAGLSQGEKAPLRVLIVGAGFAGLAAAIECRSRGMEVTLIEKYAQSHGYGDIIDFFANGGRIIERWGGGVLAQRLLEICITNAECMEIKKYDGETVYRDPWYKRPEHKKRQFAGHRGAMHKIVIDYAREIGVNVYVGKSADDFLETPTQAGVRTADGEEIWADVVIGADGPRSRAREIALGLPDIKRKSGFAIYRSFFPVTDEIRNNPHLKDYCDPTKDTIKIWIGRQCHMLGYAWGKGTNIAWVLTHPDTHDIAETWSFPGAKEDVLPFIQDYSDEAKALLEVTPPERLIDYKLVWRDPLKTWRSEGGRTIIIGDAAHTHLPSSAQGGSQGLEDAVTVAICLKRSEGDVQLALKVAERIRYNRSNVIWKAGETNRDAWNEEPWEAFRTDPEKTANRRKGWVLEFDAAENAEKHYAQIADDVRAGKPGTLEELSLPADGGS